MEKEQLERSQQNALALSAGMRLPLSDLFSRIRIIAAHEEMLTPFLRQELEAILRDGYRLLRLADSLAAAECYELTEAAAVVFPLWEELGRGLEAARLLLGAGGRTLNYELPEDNDRLRGDPAMLMRVILHLICNGLDAGDADAAVTVRGSTAGSFAIITVTDEGCGIPPEQMETMFIPYESRDRDGLPYQAPGLGLPLARRVLEAHGGSLRLISDESGTTAICSLPLYEGSEIELHSPAPRYLDDLYSPLYTVLCNYLDPPWSYPGD